MRTVTPKLADAYKHIEKRISGETAIGGVTRFYESMFILYSAIGPKRWMANVPIRMMTYYLSTYYPGVDPFNESKDLEIQKPRIASGITGYVDALCATRLITYLNCALYFEDSHIPSDVLIELLKFLIIDPHLNGKAFKSVLSLFKQSASAIVTGKPRNRVHSSGT